MPVIFDFSDYKQFLETWIRSMPKKGRGQILKLAKAAEMQPSNLSLVFSSPEKNLTLEQADGISAYLGLTKDEIEYFFLLVQHARAGKASLRRHLEQQRVDRKREHEQLFKRVPPDRILNREQRAVFYSNWYYSAIQLATNLNQMNSIEALAMRFSLPRPLVQKIVQFLLSTGLCMEKSGALRPGHKHTHLPATDPLIARHHANWRIKAIERHPLMSTESELAYSAQIALAEKDLPKVKKACLQLAEDVRKIVDSSTPEKMFALNLDWLEL